MFILNLKKIYTLLVFCLS